MKIKGLLLGMFACAALVACTNEDIVEETPDVNANKSEKAEAYLTFSIASATNSSRAITGDSHGDGNDSEHSNVGTAAENKVNEIMIVFYNTAEGATDGVAQVYNLATENSGINYNQDGTYSPTTPYQLSSTGTYNTLVILNPCDAVKKLAGPSGQTSGAESVKTIYDTILSGNYSGDVSGIIGGSGNNFMMANQKLVAINVTAANNTPALPAEPDGPILVERVASKITFRPNTLTSAPEAFSDKTNLYQIKVNHTDYEAQTVPGWVETGTGQGATYTYYEKFNVAKDKTGRDIYVLVVSENGATTTTYYTNTDGKTHAGYINGSGVTALVMNKTTIEGRPVYVQSASGTKTEEEYYVRLERYALVNLSQSVYYVRHTTDNPTLKGTPWGVVSTTKYLSDPYTPAKSNVQFAEGTMSAIKDELKSWFGTTDWTSTTAAIKEAINPASLTMFSALPGSVPDGEYGEDEDEVVGNSPEVSTIGTKLAYCMENVVSAANQKLGLTTGIIFEGQIYAKDGTKVERMYEYNGQYYLTLRALNDGTEGAFPQLNDENPDDEAIIKAGINIYKDGKCYYFSSQIKHFDYGDGTSGIMEYAIMRNNIYSLAVSDLDGFGFDSTSISEVPVDGGTDDLSVYLTLKAKIVPWIVRFNNIKF